MKFSVSVLVAALAASVHAMPYVMDVADREIADIEARNLKVRQTIGTTANEFLSGGCRSVVLVYARGTTQSGNMGEMPGPALANGLKAALGTSAVAAQGVTYSASLTGNLYSGGCPPSEAASMATLIGQVASQCPSAKIVVSGYSQGAAMVHRSIEQLSTAVKAKIVAAVTFGDTQKAQDGGAVPGFDSSKTKIFCNTGDLVCSGTLTITSAHLDYSSSVSPAVTFITSKV